MDTRGTAPTRETIINAGSGGLLPFLKELVQFRELLSFLVWKDIKIQFAQAVLGFGWLVLRPVLNVTALTLIFGKLARLPSDGVPYLLFALTGIMAWSFFSGTVGKAAMSLVANSALVTKVYFPRIYIPLSPVVSGLLELLVTFTLFLSVSILYYGRAPGTQILLLPIPLALLFLTAAGAALWLAALAVDFRDVRHASHFLLQLMMFAAPVVWPLSLLPQRFGASGEHFLDWYALYPMVGIIEGFRHALLGTNTMPWAYLGTGFISSSLLFVTGVLYFRRRERLLADVV